MGKALLKGLCFNCKTLTPADLIALPLCEPHPAEVII